MIRLADGLAVAAARCQTGFVIRASMCGCHCLGSRLYGRDHAFGSELEARFIRGVERTGQGGGR